MLIANMLSVVILNVDCVFILCVIMLRTVVLVVNVCV